MTERYFAADAQAGAAALLDGPEAHHLIHVMRAKPGTEIMLFDGRGAEFSATVERIGRTEVALRIAERRPIDRESASPITLAASLPKGDRQKWLVEKATELGVARLVAVQTARSVAQPEPKALERLRRTVVEASKQCGRNRLMEIAPPQRWADFVAATADASHRLLAHPGGTPLADFPQTGQEPLLAAIGPEGGFTDDEVALAVDAGWQPIDLGPRILRIETAAILLAALGSVSLASGETGE